MPASAPYNTSSPYDGYGPYDFFDAGQQFFFPPLVKDRPTFLPDSRPEQVELWRHFENRYRGVNVWVMSDNSIVQDTATAENSNTNLSGVYPWNPSNPSAPYVSSYFVNGPTGTQEEVTQSHNPYPVVYFQGGTKTPITPTMATLLTNYTEFGIGYADCITND